MELLNKCDRKLDSATDMDEDEKKAVEAKHISATLRAVEAIKKLRKEDVQQLLRQYDDKDGPPPFPLTHKNEPLSAFNQDVGYSCFIELFCYGDCKERDPRRREHGAALQDRAWAKTLLLRSDWMRWRLHMEFIACCFNIFLRRMQMRSIAIVVKKQWFKTRFQ